MGYGWNHSYNIFLFSQRGHMFRMDSNGRVSKYRRGPGGSYTPTTGYFETLIRNPDGTFTLTQKDKTVFHFASIPNTPFMVGGPVYRLTSIVDRNNNTTALDYLNGNLTTITDFCGRSLTLVHNSQNKLVSITDSLGRITTLEYDPTGKKLLQITDPELKSIQYSYNFMYQLTGKMDKDGKIFSYVYQNQKPVAIKDGVGDTLFSLANPNNWAIDRTALARNLMYEYIPSTTSKTDGRGNIWQYEYDKHGYLTKVIAPDNCTTTYTYDPATLKVASVTDANGNTTSYEYDAMGNLIKVTDAMLNETSYEYEPVFNNVTRITDPNGVITEYEYDGNGNRIKETADVGGLNFTTEWTYDANGNVLAEKDRNGNVTEYEYDACGNLIKIIDPPIGIPPIVVCVTEMTYDAVGNMLSRTDGNSHTTTYEYDGLDRLIGETDPLLGVTQTIYDGGGNIIQVIDCNNNGTFYEYDLRDRVVKITDALNNKTTYTYDGNDNRIAETDKNGNTTTFEYDAQNRLIEIIDPPIGIPPIPCVTSMTYDCVGNKLTETDGNGNTTTYEYDALNRLIKQTDAVNCVTEYEYDVVGAPGCCGGTLGTNLITKKIDGNGKITCFKYCAIGRLMKEIRKQGDTDCDIIDADDAVTEYDYDPNGNRLSVSVRISETEYLTTTYEYDAKNQLIKETNPASEETNYTYDCMGNVITTTSPNGNITTNTYDANDRPIQVEDLVGLLATYTYDCVGNRLSETDGNGNTTTFGYDAIYRLITVTDPMSETTQYQYDPVGNLLKVIDRELNETTHAYDALNRRISTTDALDCTTTYEYDCLGNLLKIIDANGNPTEYEYDAVNRLIKETYADPIPNTRTFTYDCVGNLLTRTDQMVQTTNYIYSDLYFLIQRNYPVSADDNFTYDLSGRMLTAERGGWLVTFTYDGANRITQTAQNGQVIDYVYNIPGRTRTITYPNGRVITEQMDLRARLDTIDDALSPPPIVDYNYDLGNRVTTRTYRNGVLAAYTYNANNWILELAHSIGVTLIAGFGHDYDKEGNKLFEEKFHDPTDSEAYQYDDIYRLLDYRVGQLVGSTVPVPSTQTDWDLDCLGNWNSKTTDGVPENRTHNAVNEITTIDALPIFHDDNGNLQEDERYIYEYDEENRLTRVTRKTDIQVVSEYQYDALNRRVVKLANPAVILTETRYFYDDARVIEEQDATAVTEATYVYGNYIDEVMTMDQGGQTYYYHQNTLWSVAAVTDSAANVVERYAYDAYGCVTITDGSGIPVPDNPWGTPHSTIGNPYMFTGRRLDEETGLYYYRARYYDCVKGRFLQKDPLGYGQNPPPICITIYPSLCRSKIENEMNLYEYVGSNPINRSDPSGAAWYGNWCGPGGGPGAPINQLDACCQAHDNCYTACGVAGVWGVVGPNACARRCDLQLCICAAKANCNWSWRCNSFRAGVLCVFCGRVYIAIRYGI